MIRVEESGGRFGDVIRVEGIWGVIRVEESGGAIRVEESRGVSGGVIRMGVSGVCDQSQRYLGGCYQSGSIWAV